MNPIRNAPHEGTNFVIGLKIVTKAAMEDTAPRVPMALGLSLVKPKAVKGMNKSQEFFNVSINTSLWQFTNVMTFLTAADALKSFTELLRSSDGFKNDDFLSSKMCNISYRSLIKFAMIDRSQNLLAVRVQLAVSVFRNPLFVSHTM